jgi:hypothetical protein
MRGCKLRAQSVPEALPLDGRFAELRVAVADERRHHRQIGIATVDRRHIISTVA